MANRYHIMGIAGAGMSAIAHLLLDQGHQVGGCDAQRNALAEELIRRGVHFSQGHDVGHVADIDHLVISSAIRPDHPEIAAARARGIAVLKRDDLWRRWSESKPTLAVAGTHGKTTTTAMATLILLRLGHQPAYIVPAGGPVPGIDRFARWGSGPLVIEADEYDRLLLGLVPEVAIITSVDWDHVDIYPSQADVETTFRQFGRQVRRSVVYCADDPGARRVASAAGGRAEWQSYGFDRDASWHIDAVEQQGDWNTFSLRVAHDPGQSATEPAVLLSGRLRVPGRHNVLNAVAAVAATAQLGVAPKDALEVLADFQGAARRFENKGEAGGILFVDDYAHNPAKVAATIAAGKARYPGRRLVVYFQPHTFSRTAALWKPLARALEGADVILVGDIYPSRERPEAFPGVDARLLLQVLGGRAVAVGGVESATDHLLEIARPGDVVITMGAGDSYKVGAAVQRRLREGARG